MSKQYLEKILASDGEIVIVSGEGEQGTPEKYTGTRTIRAIKARLAKERADGQRWVRCKIYSHTNQWGAVYVDFTTGDYCA